jgi:EAL and modified HD-GYP domain-containing signal transduction protein
MTDQSSDQAIGGQHMKEFFLARQPILNRDQNLIAYELLFRNAAYGAANVTDNLSATASVMAHVSELGLENVVGTSVGFLNIDAAVLMSDFVSFLPADKVILEILESVKVTPEVLARVAELAQSGYTFALDDVVAESEDVRQLLPLVQIIKIDIRGMDKGVLLQLSRHFKSGNKKMLAEKVETLEEFELCMQLGFDYFQGYYFAKPVILTGKKLSPSQLSILQLINQIVADVDTSEIEKTIKTDASLGLNLLRLVNSAGISGMQRIETLHQALMVLGRVQLLRWLQILLYANHGKSGSITSPLLMLATTRGKLLELIAQKLNPGNRSVADKSFTVGIMSLMDALFGQPMEKILEQIAVAEEVREALLFRKGLYGDMLKLAEYVERLEDAGPLLPPTLEKLKLSAEDFSALQLAAFQWASNVGNDSK